MKDGCGNERKHKHTNTTRNTQTQTPTTSAARKRTRLKPAGNTVGTGTRGARAELGVAGRAASGVPEGTRGGDVDSWERDRSNANASTGASRDPGRPDELAPTHVSDKRTAYSWS